jgi:predicted Fe-Mo cluster-binding NifX family protein
MKIAITSIGKDLISFTDVRFGRARYILIVDTETMQHACVVNTKNLDAPHGAGIQAAKIVVDQGADVLMTGSIGPKAFEVLKAAGVEVITGVAGRVVDVVSKYKSGVFQKAAEPDVKNHWI